MTARNELMDTADVINMEMEHFRIHTGEMNNFSIANTIASAAIQDILLVTPATASGYMHIKMGVGGEAAAKISFYGDGAIATTTSYGTTQTAYNMNRNSAKTNNAQWFVTTAFTTTLGAPILLNRSVIGTTGTPVTRIGGEARPGNEWILKPSTQYIVRIENLAGSTQTTSFNAQYYAGIKGD